MQPLIDTSYQREGTKTTFLEIQLVWVQHTLFGPGYNALSQDKKITDTALRNSQKSFYISRVTRFQPYLASSS